METKPVTHTAGPWHIDAEVWLGEEYGYWLDIGPAKLFIDWHSTSYKGKLELESVQFNMADACLIAAAPELLAALQEVYNSIQYGHEAIVDSAKIAAVITKATGGAA